MIAGVGAASLAAVAAGCSSNGSLNPSGAASNGAQTSPASAADTGSVGMSLTLPGGEVVNTVTWQVTGPNGASTLVQSGQEPVGNSSTVTFLIGGIPAGNSYSITLSATSTDGTSTCSGSATFNTTARTTTNVSVQLQCTTPGADAGSTLVNGSLFNCATVTSATATPAETNVGTSVAVAASATAPNPGALTYAWTATSGTFDNPSSQAPHFTCTAAGAATLTVTVTDGAVPDGGACSATASTTTIPVTCAGHLDAAQQLATATPIKHVVIVFGENISFDHYFGTYPQAQNNPGEVPFTPVAGTPQANNLVTPLDPTHGFAPLSGVNLLTNNPNLNPANNSDAGTGAANPFRLAAAQAATEDQGHNYKPEQQASDDGGMDLFPKYTGAAGPPPSLEAGAPPAALTNGLVMAYYDGNTVGELWNLAQNYALNDNHWTTTFGPSTPGALNLISGQTDAIIATNAVLPDGGSHALSTSHVIGDGNGGYTQIGDTDPIGDVCSSAADQTSLGGTNIGNLLNAQGVSWGWFEGGFDLTITNVSDGGVVASGSGCNRTTAPTVPGYYETSTDYIPHHQPFQYYASTANPMHARPSAVTSIGSSVAPDGGADPANHQYDSHDFFDALAAGNLPAVVFLKAPAFQDGHAGYSDPVDEGNFIASVVNALQAAQEWSSTAIIFTYDDSDGWYDHQAPPIVNRSSIANVDELNGNGLCFAGAQQGDGGVAPATPLLGALLPDGGAAPGQGRCGYGTRIPLLVVSPYAKHNFIDHTLTDQTSVLRFIEDNWLNGQRIQPGGSFDTIANPISNMLNVAAH